MSNTVPASFKPSGPPVVPFPSAGMLPGIPTQPSQPAESLETFLAEHRVQLVVDEHHRPDGFDFGRRGGRTSVITAPGFDPAYILAKVKPMVASWEADKIPFEQATSDGRTFTYPLVRGGSITATCPDWCVSDHAHDLRHNGIHPSDLTHETEDISLVLTTFGGDPIGTLHAVITQEPFADTDRARPGVQLCPIEGDESLENSHMSARQFGEVIDQLQAHVDRLRQMQERLAQITADEHAAYHRRLDEVGSSSPRRSWESLRLEDIQSMPVAYLLKVFGGSVVEADAKDFPDDRAGWLQGEPGELTLRLLRTLPQSERESVVRELLGRLSHEARNRGGQA